MTIDDLGHRAGHDVQRTAHRLEASLPSVPDVVERGLRLRARRRAAGLAVLILPLVLSVALAAAGPGGDGRTSTATDGSATVGSSDDGSSTTPDEPTTPSREESCYASEGPATSGVGDRTECVTSTSLDLIDDDETPTPTTVTIPADDDTATTTTTSDTTSDGLGRVSGSVMAGPTCAVQSADEPCDDLGIVATITFTMIREDAEFLYERTVTSASDGSYSIELAAGDFSVTVTSDSAMSCDNATVTVIDREVVTLNLSCDTGIR